MLFYTGIARKIYNVFGKELFFRKPGFFEEAVKKYKIDKCNKAEINYPNYGIYYVEVYDKSDRMTFDQLPNGYKAFFEPSWTRYDCINTSDKINKYSMDRMLIYQNGNLNYKSMRDQYAGEAGAPLGGKLDNNGSWHIVGVIVYHYPNCDKYKIDQLYANHSRVATKKRKKRNNNKKRGGNKNKNGGDNNNDNEISIASLPSIDLDAQF